MQLSKVVQVDKDKCVNCHACISACPVKYCIKADEDHVGINDDMCIGCGSCIEACTHDARTPVDDFQKFLHDVKENKTEITAVVAPAVASNFPDTYLNLNGWLKSLGIKYLNLPSFLPAWQNEESSMKPALEIITLLSNPLQPISKRIR